MARFIEVRSCTIRDLPIDFGGEQVRELSPLRRPESEIIDSINVQIKKGGNTVLIHELAPGETRTIRESKKDSGGIIIFQEKTGEIGLKVTDDPFATEEEESNPQIIFMDPNIPNTRYFADGKYRQHAITRDVLTYGSLGEEIWNKKTVMTNILFDSSLVLVYEPPSPSSMSMQSPREPVAVS